MVDPGIYGALLIDGFNALPKKPQILLCQPVPVIGEGRFTINEPNRQKILPLIAELARSNGLQLAGLDAALQNRPELYLDTVHPNMHGTAVFASEIAVAVESLLVKIFVFPLVGIW